ncbi:hypothetical protein PHMEG_00029132 [Phytophthora megakarya]|uniref:Uncharacterized protein n=1 Tax=Phytophthora megakarya TaxID=4795 RepID=A0A225V4A2_9STRA|nr:hypothetical protein PHMEG_00029132 [Phytophthora megakarya]
MWAFQITLCYDFSPLVGENGSAARSIPITEDVGGPTEQIAVSPIDVFGLDQDRFIDEQYQTPWIMAMIVFLESGALALDAQLREKVLLMAPQYVVKNGVL